MTPLGDRAVLLLFDGAAPEQAREAVRRAAAAISRQQPAWLVELVPAYASLAVHFDPILLANDASRPSGERMTAYLSDRIREWLSETTGLEASPPRTVELPVCYGGEFGPDLEEAAAIAGFHPDEVVRIHSSAEYRVAMIGFVPGFPYLTGLPAELALPRLSEPRTRVEAGSVGIGGAQTGVYPIASPGGWRIIGRTPLQLFHPRREPASLLLPGDFVRFRPISPEEFTRLAEQEMTGLGQGRSVGRAGSKRIGMTGTKIAESSESKHPAMSPPAAGDSIPLKAQGCDPADSARLCAGSLISRGSEKYGGQATGNETDAVENDGVENTVLTVVKPGLWTTVQDLGRTGHRWLGVPVSGAMDTGAMRAANLLVGNEEGAAVLEITLRGPVLRFERPALISVCGADLAPTVNRRPLPMWRAVLVSAGTILAFGPARIGCRAYLAVAGGFDVPPVLGSRSTYAPAGFGGLDGRPLRKGDVLPAGTPSAQAARLAEQLRRSMAPHESYSAADWFLRPFFYADVPSAGGTADNGGSAPFKLRVVRGAEFESFDEAGRNAFFNAEFRISPRSNRMGYRLEGPPMRAEAGEMLSHGVTPGTIQVPAGGQPIILTADGQTTGGYAKIAHLIGADLPRLAQAKPGDAVHFAEVDLEEAIEATRAQEERFVRLKRMIDLRV
jgi:KipI family sensor histidine kinase inhibitor